MSFLSKLFNNGEEFREVRVDMEVLESVIYYAKKAFPDEFLAFFDGEIIDKVLYITSLIFLPGETGHTGAVVHTEMLPTAMKYWGSVHSHPGPSADPSGADLQTFSKHGFFHMIVCLPYSLETFKAYDRYGNNQDYTVGDYSHLIDDDELDIFDEDDIVNDNDDFKPGFFDEEDDEFFKTLDDEKSDEYSKYENNHITASPNEVLFIQIDKNGNIKNVTRKPKE